MGYCGRFAPSPTGPLHLGSLVTAVGGYLDARAQGGRWLLRMEDVDRPRTVAGAADSILRTLEAFGLWWDGPVSFQSTRDDAYRAALEQLIGAGDAFACGCTRREIVDSVAGPRPSGEVPYPGTCRAGLAPGRERRSWRMKAPQQPVGFIDRRLGRQLQDVAAVVGDFVLLRADGCFAYQLAVVVDDAAQGISDVVRGADLLESTARQIWLQRRLGFAEPRYLHLPLVTNAEGQKLSKQTQAAPVDASNPGPALRRALEFLGQAPPAELAVDELLDWATRHWSVAAIPSRNRAV